MLDEPESAESNVESAQPKRSARVRPFLIRLGISIGGIFLLLAGGTWYWYHHRPQPPDIHRRLFEGIEYRRISRKYPRPIVIHVVRIDLSASEIGFRVTPPDQAGDRPLRARTTSGFLRDFDVQLAINGDGFSPWWSHTLWDYYPRIGDAVGVAGYAASAGKAYSRAQHGPATLFISRDNRVTIGKPDGAVNEAISGLHLMLEDGKPAIRPRPVNDEPHPRTALGLDESGGNVFILVVDGRQPNYSEGVLLTELVDLMREFGVWEGINLDGGGSTTLVAQGADGRPEVLNCPIDNRIPGRERAVANHIGVFARPLR